MQVALVFQHKGLVQHGLQVASMAHDNSKIDMSHSCII